MASTLEIRVRARALPLSKNSRHILANLGRYDLIVFTSKNAVRFFTQELRKRHLTLPRARMRAVGPRKNLLALPLTGKRVLFPRSAIAPGDILGEMRRRAASVRTISLYTVDPVPLTARQKRALLSGGIKSLYFKSPSGVAGLLKQLRGAGRTTVQAIPAICIGETTARAARKAGWKKVSIKPV
ncbi:MAG TPA: uroporphyrinogen-III synthase [Candidatus Paceibacterota bacterium]|nr:uroporphyrinogen-III synthase [Candidatus Paceibacterota bacterium]